jgi:hypothetical protein
LAAASAFALEFASGAPNPASVTSAALSDAGRAAGNVCSGEAAGSSALADDAFHYTFGRFLSSIQRNGLRPGSYATTTSELSPLQAQIDLALSPNRGLTDTILRVDLAGLRRAGYAMPTVTPVARSFNMPGGGVEMQFPYPIPPEFLSVLK